MKLIKKIAAIMFAFMMVVSMSTNVSAEGTEKGTITINKAVDGQTYTIYKILDLESYDKAKNLYSYKPAKGWESFINRNTDYFIKNDYDGISWKANEGETEAQAQERACTLAKKALEYAKNPSNSITSIDSKTASSATVTFSDLDLGYYLVDSSVGALCSLNTTNSSANIQEKNGQPTVEKKVSSTDGTGYGETNDVNIGDTVYFQTIITAQAGAQDYVLHDTMDEGFTFTNNIQVKLNDDLVQNQDYSIYLKNDETNKITDECTFEIKFMKEFCDKLKENDKIYVTYTATLNSKAFIGIKNDGSGNTNATKITYGANNKESVESKTQTYTYQIPVYKYTGTDENKQGLAGAKFKLYTNTDFIEANEVKVKEEVGAEYFVGSTDDKKNVMTSPQSGEFTIKGLKAGTYYLKEIEAPKGYNLLANAVEVHITEAGKVEVRNGETLKEVNRVDVQNKSGTLLPSTGGAGTTMIYLVGALLVLGSGVVLASKRRSNSK